MRDERMQDYDPLLDPLHDSVRRVQRQLYKQTARPVSRWHRTKLSVSVHIANNWLDYVLAGTPIALLGIAVVVFVGSRPWQEPGQDQQTVVAACASVVALGSIIAGALSVPVSRAVDLGPGIMTGLIRSPRFWLPGLTVAPTAVFLFWLASRHPDDEAALASAFLAGGTYAAYWSATRAALAAADLMKVADREQRRLLRNMRRFMGVGGQLANATMATDLPSDAKVATAADYRAQLGAVPIRQVRTIARRLFGQGATEEGLMFCTAMLEGLDLLAKENEGAIGGYNGLPAEVLESLEDFVAVSMLHHDDFVAVRLVERMAALAVFPYGHPDASALRLHARGRLLRVLDRTWRDQDSRVPGAAAGRLGALPAQLTEMGAHGDAQASLSTLRDVILKALPSDQAHIGGPAMSGFINQFAAALETHRDVRQYHLKHWKGEAKAVATVRALPETAFLQPFEQLLPGLSATEGAQMQEVLLGTLSAPDTLSDAAWALLRAPR